MSLVLVSVPVIDDDVIVPLTASHDVRREVWLSDIAAECKP